MQARPGFEPWWAALTVWAVVNAVNVLPAAGVLSRVPTESTAVNHPMFRLNRQRWLVTVATTVLSLVRWASRCARVSREV
jgi:hypothetical protein